MRINVKPDSVKFRVTFAIWPFVAGLVCFVLYFLTSGHPMYIGLLGWTLFACAYFIVLATNYRNKKPVPALGRIVDFEKQPALYRSIYVLLAFAGALSLLVLFLIHMF